MRRLPGPRDETQFHDTGEAVIATYLIAALPILRHMRRLGGVGLMMLGIAGGVLPLPASLEVVTVWLAARHRELWWYYGLMAALGSSLGSSVFYFVGWKGGAAVLGKRLSASQAKQWMERLATWGFGSVVVSGLLPPPVPSSPILMAAGAVRYSRKRFAVALMLGRTIRFLLLAYLGYLYRRRAMTMMNRLLVPIMVAGITASIGYIAYRWYAGHKDRQDKDRRTAAPAGVGEQAELSPGTPTPEESNGAAVTPQVRRSIG